MTDDFTQNRSDKLVAVYQRFRDTIDATAPGGKSMPYHWWTLPNPLGGIWMPYRSMLGEYATELANIINDLTNHVNRLRAWEKIISELDNDEKFAVIHEFLNTLGTVALGQPYAIKSRFAFASGHLCHQANQARQSKVWVDEFPNRTSTSTIFNLMALVGGSSAFSRFEWKQSGAPPSRLPLMTFGMPIIMASRPDLYWVSPALCDARSGWEGQIRIWRELASPNF